MGHGAKNVREGVMDEFYLVWCEENGNPTYKHPVLEQAKAEAERLARNNPGKVFNVLGLIDSCRKNDIVWAS